MLLCFEELHQRFLVTLTDKVNGNVAVTSKITYPLVQMKKTTEEEIKQILLKLMKVVEKSPMISLLTVIVTLF